MHSAKLTIIRILPLFFIVLGLQHTVNAQENSPYSRYGLGDIVPSGNIMNRGMGGVAAGMADYSNVNFVNPASYGNLRSTVFDLSIEVDSRKLKSFTPPSTFTSTNGVISYLQLAFPIKMKKANKKDIFWAWNIGLRPVTRVNYKILRGERRADLNDTLTTINEGTGGVNQAFIGTGLKIKSFSIGFNGGYMFGNKDYSTQIAFNNDTVQYAQSNTMNQTSFGSVFLNAGIQFEHKFKSKDKKRQSVLRFGAYGNLKQNLKATLDNSVETFVYDANGAKFKIDSVYQNSVKGKVIYPATLGVGLSYQTNNWLFAADFETTKWTDYRYYGQEDTAVRNNWKIRVGTEYLPLKDNTPFKKYFSFVRYRFGAYYGPDYIEIGNKRPEYGFSFGAGFPLKLRRGYYDNQTSLLNTAIEFGSRGNTRSNLRESTFRVSLGFAISDLWFLRAKYQ